VTRSDLFANLWAGGGTCGAQPRRVRAESTASSWRLGQVRCLPSKILGWPRWVCDGWPWRKGHQRWFCSPVTSPAMMPTLSAVPSSV